MIIGNNMFSFLFLFEGIHREGYRQRQGYARPLQCLFREDLSLSQPRSAIQQLLRDFAISGQQP